MALRTHVHVLLSVLFTHIYDNGCCLSLSVEPTQQSGLFTR